MKVAGTIAPAYNVQTAVDAEHALIVTHAVTLDAGQTTAPCSPWPKPRSRRSGDRQLSTSSPTPATPTASMPSRCEAAGIDAACARHTRHQQPGRRLAVRPQPLPSINPRPTPSSALMARRWRRIAAVAQRPRRSYYQAEAQRLRKPVRSRPRCTPAPQRMVTRHLHDGRAQSHAPTRYTRADAAAKIYGRASLRHPQVPHLRTSPPAAARASTARSTEIGLAIMAYNLLPLRLATPAFARRRSACRYMPRMA